jgi:hypothetical protein
LGQTHLTQLQLEQQQEVQELLLLLLLLLLALTACLHVHLRPLTLQVLGQLPLTRLPNSLPPPLLLLLPPPCASHRSEQSNS